MITMDAITRAWLADESTERDIAVRLEIRRRSDNDLVHVIDCREEGDTHLLPGGSVRVDPSADCLRTASFTVVDENARLSVGPGQLIAPDKRFVLSKGLWVPGLGAYSFAPLGTFELSGEPNLTPETGLRRVSLQVADKSSNANGRPRGGLLAALRVTAGVRKVVAIKAIATSEWGETQFNLWEGSQAEVPYAYAFDDTTSPWEAVQRLNEIPEPDGTITRLYYDALGRLTLAPDPGPNIDQLPAVWRAVVNPDGFSQLVSASKSMDMFGAPNVVIVKYGSEQVTPGVAIAQDDDPNSDWAVSKIGRIIYRWKNGRQDDLIWTYAEALARAQFELRNRRTNAEKLPLVMLDNPWLEPWDVAYVDEGAADAIGNYQLQGFTISLDTDTEAALTMQADGGKVRRFA